MSHKPLTESVLCRLSAEGLTSFLRCSRGFEAVSRAGCDLILSNEPVADMNGVIVGQGPRVEDAFRQAVSTCLSRDLPFLAILFPEAGKSLPVIAAESGLVHAADFPFMVREGLPIESSGHEAIDVWRATGTDDEVLGQARILAGAFQMPLEATTRAFPSRFMVSPDVDIYLAATGGRMAGAVTFTHHGETTGVWGMGTDPELQGRGIGRRLLSSAMAQAWSKGSRRFFLGATAAGFPLYEKLGYETRVVTSVWVAGETSQA